jgi:hypothetical protein
MILPRIALFSALSLISYHSAAQTWPRYSIDSLGSGADGIKLGDINADGWLDFVTGWEESGLTKLYLNPGPAKVKQAWPRVVLGQTPAVEDAVLADVDGDGRMEVVSCSEKGQERIFIHWQKGRELLQEENWQQSILPASDGSMMWMYAEPWQIDGKHAVDLVAAGKEDRAAIGWFETSRKTSRQNGDWKWHPISSVGWIMSIELQDMDGDKDMDLLITDRYGPLQGCRWLENPGKKRQQKSPWRSHMIGAEGLEVMFLDLADLDGDGIKEILVSERTEQSIRIFRRLDQPGTKWTEQVLFLPPSTGLAKSVAAGDLNNDGTVDLVISTNTEGKSRHGLFWWDGKQLDQEGTPVLQTISGAHNAKYDKVELIDLDDDGDLDVLICEENYGENSEGLGVIWYENRL